MRATGNASSGRDGELSAQVRKALSQAEQFYQAGEYGAAAELFERLAQAAETQRRSSLASDLYLRAASAWVFAGDTPHAMELIHISLKLLARLREWDHLRAAGQSAQQELERLKLPQWARQVSTWTNALLPVKPAAPPKASAVHLPPRCPTCSMPISPQKVIWADANTPTCPYCEDTLPILP